MIKSHDTPSNESRHRNTTVLAGAERHLIHGVRSDIDSEQKPGKASWCRGTLILWQRATDGRVKVRFIIHGSDGRVDFSINKYVCNCKAWPQFFGMHLI